MAAIPWKHEVPPRMKALLLSLACFDLPLAALGAAGRGGPPLGGVLGVLSLIQLPAGIVYLVTGVLMLESMPRLALFLSTGFLALDGVGGLVFIVASLSFENWAGWPSIVWGVLFLASLLKVVILVTFARRIRIDVPKPFTRR